MKMLHCAAFVLVLVGALNWGLVGLLGVNLVTMLLGSAPSLVSLVYVLVGLSAVYLALSHKEDCLTCCGGKKGKK